MCGIFGVINFNGQPVDKEKVLSARDVLAHRGPDDSGIYFSSINQSIRNPESFDKLRTGSVEGSINQSKKLFSVALAHRRLSIIDLSTAAHQPMVSDDGRFVIVFNGEIYNYRELQDTVRSKKLEVRSQSDTEVILKLFEAEGAECLKRLRGMFAFAIWDDKEKKLFAARDRFGIKPFYYLHNNRELIFSSELKAIKHYKNGLTLSMEGMDAFLKTGSVPAPLTIYEETKSLLPGCYLEFERSKVKCQTYWSFFDLLNNQPNPVIPAASGIKRDTNDRFQTSWNDRFRTSRNDSTFRYDDEAKKIIRDSLLDSVKAHMVSDVEVGAFLSGGIDSTAIVSLMRQAGHEKIKTIAVTFPGFIYDEAEFSNVAAQVFGTDHYEYRLQEHEIIDEFDKIIESMDQPTIDGINTYFVSKAAKSFGLKVVLSGLGGDELFGGYPSFYRIPRYYRLANLPLAGLAMKAAIPFLKNKLPGKAIRFMKEPGRLNAEYILLRGLFTDDELKELGWNHNYKHPFAIDTTVKNYPDIYDVNHPLFNIKNNPLQFVCEMETNHYMRNQLLRDSDIFSMSHSLELRVPFVDHLLYKDVLPYLHSSFDKNESKKMLVNAARDLPRVISERMKMGFTFPFDVWMRSGKLNNTIKNSLLHDKSFDLIPLEARKKLLDKFEQRKIHWSRVWALIVLSRFGS
jgi:asparagine synthase (glutamine-hydrolysing)